MSKCYFCQWYTKKEICEQHGIVHKGKGKSDSECSHRCARCGQVHMDLPDKGRGHPCLQMRFNISGFQPDLSTVNSYRLQS